MGAEAEREVRVGIAQHVEALGVLDPALVVVGRAEQQQHLVALGDGDTV